MVQERENFSIAKLCTSLEPQRFWQQIISVLKLLGSNHEVLSTHYLLRALGRDGKHRDCRDERAEITCNVDVSAPPTFTKFLFRV